MRTVVSAVLCGLSQRHGAAAGHEPERPGRTAHGLAHSPAAETLALSLKQMEPFAWGPLQMQIEAPHIHWALARRSRSPVADVPPRVRGAR